MKEFSKVEVGTRFIAALIDAAIGWAVGFIPVIGGLIGAAYMLVKDGLFEGQSVGKKVMNLQVVNMEGVKADFSLSAKRNVIFAIPLLLMVIPILGWVVAPFLSLIILIIEALKVMNDPQGRRIGDNWADTQVIAFKEIGEAQDL